MSELFPKTAWYAVSGASALAAGEVIPVQLFGEERVGWRGSDGKSHVWQNQCVHRGMRLQYGFVDGDRLACRYHGWRFGGDAKCEVIPAHPDMTPPDDYCVPAHPSAEKHGLVWTTGEETGDVPPKLPGGADIVFCRSIAVNVPAEHAAEIVADAGLPATAAGVYSGTIDINGVETLVVVAVQPVNAAKSQLHVLADNTSGEHDVQTLRLAAAAWAMRLRDLMEIGARKESAA